MGSSKLKWEMLVGMKSVELLIIVVIRIILGWALTIAFGMVAWAMVRSTFPQVVFSAALFSSVTTLLIGGSAALGAALAWWNTESPRSVRLLSAALAVVTGALSSWIGFQLLCNTHLIWVSEIGKDVPVIYQSEALFAMITAATIGGNAVAGVLYLYRALLRREV